MNEDQDEIQDCEGDDSPRGRGRPPTGEAKSNAERQRAYREAKRLEGLVPLTVYIPTEMMVALDNFLRFKDLDKDTVVQRCIRRELMRKR